MNNTPEDFKVSLIAPVRDEEASIRPFLQALLKQKFSPDEIILTDGGSTDKTKEIIKEFIAQGHVIRLLEDAEAYPGRARNLAIQASRNEWIALVDAGTLVEADWLDKLIGKAASDPEAKVILGTYQPILTNFFKEGLALTYVAPAQLIEGRWFRGPSTASMMLQKGVWETLGKFPEDLRACEDLLFFERLKRSDFVIRYAADALVRWHIQDDLAAVFRKFRAYSQHTLKARLGRTWHLALAKMYAIGAVFLLLAMAHHWSWFLLIVAALFWRTQRSIQARKASLTLKHRIGIHTYLLVAGLLLCIDVAALCGALDYYKSR
ncbi:MAG: glycosyltransferase [Acidobacteria bacterium]|nr:glycosyltransferase [Acidobacteriota bacterium]